jgi:hypothetical protein
MTQENMKINYVHYCNSCFRQPFSLKFIGIE